MIKVKRRWGVIIFEAASGQPKLSWIDIGDAWPVNQAVCAVNAYIQPSSARDVFPPDEHRQTVLPGPSRETRNEDSWKDDAVKYIQDQARTIYQSDQDLLQKRLQDAFARFPSLDDALAHLRERLDIDALLASSPKCVYVVQNGSLSSMSFEMLLADNRTPAGRLPDIRYYVPTRRIFERVISDEAATARKNAGIVVVYAPDYNSFDSRRKIDDTVISAIQSKVSIAPSNAHQIFRVGGLDGTVKEAESVRNVTACREITGAAATKSAVLNIKRPQVLHIATHGYVFGEDQGESKALGVLPSGNNPLLLQAGFVDGVVSDPYLRTGLVFAGANWRWTLSSPPAEAGDGVITAHEILDMDLRGTRLVVLSACETAYGEALPGRAVASLAEVFLLAGARSVVASLWKLPDQQAATIMGDFYANMAEGTPVGAALHSAKQKARERWPSDSTTWANYQCFGDGDVVVAI